MGSLLGKEEFPTMRVPECASNARDTQMPSMEAESLGRFLLSRAFLRKLEQNIVFPTNLTP